MKVCRACGSARIKATVDSRFVSLTGRLQLDDELVRKLRKKHKLIPPEGGAVIGAADLQLSDDFEPSNLAHYSKVACAECGKDEFDDKLVCPRCHDQPKQVHFCDYEGQIICSKCRDGYCCRNDCRYDVCPAHPRYKGGAYAGEAEQPWNDPDWDDAEDAPEPEPVVKKKLQRRPDFPEVLRDEGGV